MAGTLRLVRTVLCVALVALLAGACSARGAGTTSTSQPEDPGFPFQNLQCDSDDFVDTAVYDYPEGAQGHATVGDTMEAFRAKDSNWLAREDWHGLTMGVTTASPVEFKDERGSVYLSVDLEHSETGWLVSGFATCTPSDQ